MTESESPPATEEEAPSASAAEAPPLAVDIDGTLTRADQSVDARVFDVLREWPAPVVIATGKSLPYPIGLCDFVGIPQNVVAENGGVVYTQGADEFVFNGDREAAEAVVSEFREAGYSLGWEGADLVNRWRETEIAVARDQPLSVLEAIAADHGLEVVDTGYAYHVKTPGVTKGEGLKSAAREFHVDVDAFVAIGDSANDVPAFEVAGRSFAVANADADARAAADEVTEAGYAEGFMEAIARIRGETG